MTDPKTPLFAHTGVGERYKVAPIDELRERAETAALYRLSCSPHELTQEDSLAMAAYVAALAGKPGAMTGGWRPIGGAPRDGTVIWAMFRTDIFPRIRPEREDLAPWNGIQIPLVHDGYDGRIDYGWRVRAPVGMSGFPDEWIAGWREMPTAPSPQQLAILDQEIKAP